MSEGAGARKRASDGAGQRPAKRGRSAGAGAGAGAGGGPDGEDGAGPGGAAGPGGGASGEPAPRSEAEGVLVELCRARPEGLPLEEAGELVKLHGNDMLAALNTLLEEHRLQVLELGNGSHVYRMRDWSLASKFVGLKADEVTVYTAIERAQNKGIWSRDLKKQVSQQHSMSGNNVDKVTRHLLTRQLIKVVKSIASKNKRVFMLFDLEPSLEVRGRCWYRGHEFDTEFFGKLQDAAVEYVRRRGEANCNEVTRYVGGLQDLAAVSVGKDDVLDLLDSLCYDGTLERVPRGDGAGAAELARIRMGENPDSEDEEEEEQAAAEAAAADANSAPKYLVTYRPLRSGAWDSASAHIPCTSCSVREVCHPDGVVNPKGCPYIAEWLDF